jgi:hypothetical protein
MDTFDPDPSFNTDGFPEAQVDPADNRGYDSSSEYLSREGET